MMPHPIGVLVVDAQRLFRHCLTAALSRRRRLRVVGEADTGGRAIDLARSLRPDVVILDPALPDGGPDLVAALGEAHPDSAVLIVTAAGGDDVGPALQAGARGYLDKDCELDHLTRVIERVHAGELIVAPRPASDVFRDGSPSTAPGPEAGNLTARELDVLRLVARGRTNSEIARELHITEHTAKAHVARIRGKLALENRVQLAAFAVHQGLSSPADEPAVPDRVTG